MLDLFVVPTLVATLILVVSLIVWWWAIEWAFKPYKPRQKIVDNTRTTIKKPTRSIHARSINTGGEVESITGITKSLNAKTDTRPTTRDAGACSGGSSDRVTAPPEDKRLSSNPEMPATATTPAAITPADRGLQRTAAKIASPGAPYNKTNSTGQAEENRHSANTAKSSPAHSRNTAPDSFSTARGKSVSLTQNQVETRPENQARKVEARTADIQKATARSTSTQPATAKNATQTLTTAAPARQISTRQTTTRKETAQASISSNSKPSATAKQRTPERELVTEAESEATSRVEHRQSDAKKPDIPHGRKTGKNKHSPKYQTAAKANSPSVRNEASLQIADPSVRPTTALPQKNEQHHELNQKKIKSTTTTDLNSRQTSHPATKPGLSASGNSVKQSGHGNSAQDSRTHDDSNQNSKPGINTTHSNAGAKTPRSEEFADKNLSLTTTSAVPGTSDASAKHSSEANCEGSTTQNKLSQPNKLAAELTTNSSGNMAGTKAATTEAFGNKNLPQQTKPVAGTSADPVKQPGNDNSQNNSDQNSLNQSNNVGTNTNVTVKDGNTQTTEASGEENLTQPSESAGSASVDSVKQNNQGNKAQSGSGNTQDVLAQSQYTGKAQSGASELTAAGGNSTSTAKPVGKNTSHLTSTSSSVQSSNQRNNGNNTPGNLATHSSHQHIGTQGNNQESRNKSSDPETKQPVVFTKNTTDGNNDATTKVATEENKNRNTASNVRPFNAAANRKNLALANIGSNGQDGSNGNRKQSPIELAMAKKEEVQQSSVAQTQHTPDDTQKTPPVSPSPSFSATSDDNVQSADTALRTELELSKKRVASLQATLNKMQHSPTATTETSVAQSNEQVKRPTLLSKVRVLDSLSV